MLDATERGEIDPKQVAALNSTLKAIKELGIDIPLKLMGMIQKSRQNGDVSIPKPRGVMLRSFMGLSPDTETSPRVDGLPAHPPDDE